MKLRVLLPIVLFTLILSSCDLFSFFNIGVPGTNTVTPASIATETEPPQVTQTMVPSMTSTPVRQNSTPTPKIRKPTATPDGEDKDGPEEPQIKKIFSLQPGSPTSIHAWSHDCSWLGIAGQVFNKTGQPVEGLVIEAGGKLQDQNVLGLSITGIESLYGPGGYEIKLWEETVASSQSIWVQIKNASGDLLSNKVFLDTKDDCNHNLILLNFIEVDPFSERLYYFPLVSR
jgi:hypothetical protein